MAQRQPRVYNGFDVYVCPQQEQTVVDGRRPVTALIFHNPTTNEIHTLQQGPNGGVHGASLSGYNLYTGVDKVQRPETISDWVYKKFGCEPKSFCRIEFEHYAQVLPMAEKANRYKLDGTGYIHRVLTLLHNDLRLTLPRMPKSADGMRRTMDPDDFVKYLNQPRFKLQAQTTPQVVTQAPPQPSTGPSNYSSYYPSTDRSSAAPYRQQQTPSWGYV